MRIVAFSGDVWEHASPTLRVVKPITAAGFELVRGNEWIGQNILVRSEFVEQADLVLIQRDFATHAEEYSAIVALAQSAGKPIVYDVDDLLLELPENHPDFPRYQQSRLAALRAVAEADLVTVSTHTLRALLLPFNTNIQVLPNCLPDDLWGNAVTESTASSASRGSEGLCIGFVGSHTHTADLEMIAQVIIEIVEAQPGVKFISWGCPLPADLLPVAEQSPLALVRYADFTSFVRGIHCDIVVAPLVESTFNSCKSALKFLEYSALGFPGVYSAWGEFREIVSHGETGLLAASVAEWREHLSALAADSALRSQISQKAKAFVREHRMLSKNAWRWQEALSSIPKLQSLPRRAFAFFAAAARWHAYDTKQLRDSQKMLESQAHHLRGENQGLRAQLDDLRLRSEQESQALRAQLDDLRLRSEQESQALRDQLHELQLQSSRVQSEYSNLQRAYEEARKRLQWAEQRLVAIESGPGWQLLAKIWPIRRALIPPGSARERMFKRIVGVLTGNSLMLALPPSVSGHPAPRSITSSAEHVVPSAQRAGSVTATAATVDLVVLAKPADALPIMDWLASQTWRADKTIFYDWKERSSYQPGSQQRQPQDLSAILQSLGGRYTGFVTVQHTRLHSTFIEENIIALESQKIAFTSNLPSDQIAGRLNLGWPLASMFLRRELLRYSAEGNLRLAVSDLQGDTLGKVIPSRLTIDDIAVELRLDLPVAVRDGYVVREGSSPAVTLQSFDHLAERASDRRDSKPTVIVVFPFIAVGGAERVALDMMRFLKHEVNFIVVATDPVQLNAATMVDAFREIAPHTYLLEDFLHPESRTDFFDYLIKSRSPRVVYIANGSVWIYQHLLPYLKQKHPAVRVANQVYDHTFGWIEWYDTRLAGQIDAHIGVNRSICNEYARRGAREESIYLVEHGIDTEEFDPARYSPEDIAALRHKLGIPEGKRVVTFIARFHQQKRPLDFVELSRSLQDDERLFFLMVGDGPLGPVVEQEISRLGLSNLRRMGFYHPSRDIFAVSDLVVLPSEYEGMPLVILEAQAMGKPVVVTDVGNNREVLEITGGGIVVPRVGDTRALRRFVLEALDRSFDAKKMRESVRSLFDWRVIALKYRRALLGE